MNKSEKVTISVIVSALNVAKYIPKCLDALLGQTFQDIEVICINDGSSDDTGKVLAKYAKKDSRVTVLTNDHCIGLSASRNRGLEIAKGKYILFCDADDYYEPTACEELYNALTSSDADIAICEINVVYEAHRELKPSDDLYYSLKYSGLRRISDEQIINTDLNATNKLFKKSIMDENNLRFPDGLMYEDAYFCAAYFCLSRTVYYVNSRLYNYIRRDGSIMSNTFKRTGGRDIALDHLEIASRLYDYLSEHGLLADHVNLFWELFARLAANTLRFCHPENRCMVRTRIVDFVSKHQDTFSRANINIQNDVTHLSSSRFSMNGGRLKRLLLRFMPTLRLQIENVLHARVVAAKNKELLREIDECLEEEYLD